MARAVILAALALLAAAALASPASAREVVLRDDEGRAIRFDDRAGVDLEWYAGHLRRAAHASEIERVTVRVVTWDELRERCGRGAAGCYSRRRGNQGVIVVPAGRDAEIAHTLVHEYGHHVDASRRHGNLPEPNGTPLWWKARGMAELVASRSVRDRYEVGWDRSIGEVFAEDYAYANLGRGYRIRWLRPPSRVVQQAILADLGLAPRPRIDTTSPDVRPVVIVREGTLEPNGRVSVDFGLLGPDRKVSLVGSLGGGSGARGRVEVTCGDVLRRSALSGPRTTASLVLPQAGPGQCRASIVNTGAGAGPFRFTVRLSLG